MSDQNKITFAILPVVLNLCQIDNILLNKSFMVKIQDMSSFDHDTSFFLDQPQPQKWNGLPDIQKKKHWHWQNKGTRQS